MRGYIDTRMPSYRELLDKAAPDRSHPPDERAGAELAVDRRTLRGLLAASAALAVGMALAVAWLLE